MLPLCFLAQSAPADPAPVTFESLLGELVERRAACEFPDPAFVCRQASSYDRASRDPQTDWFANQDVGQFVRFETIEGRAEAVLMDASGPGALVRVWLARPKGTLRVYLDDAESAALSIPVEEWSAGRGPLPPALAQETSSGWNLYLPVPYAQRCVVTSDAPDRLAYECSYRTYAAGTQVESLRGADLETRSEAIARAADSLMEGAPLPSDRVEEFDLVMSAQSGRGAVRSFEFDVPARRGQEPAGARALTELSLALEPESGERAERLERLLRSTVLSLSFDGHETARTPLGDFFGSAPGLNAYASWPFEVRASGELTCRFPMPFRENARVRVEALGSDRVHFHGRIASAAYTWSERTLYFHARWKSESLASRPTRDWNVADIAGRGVYAGDMLTVGNPVLAWWGEGDEKIYVDGESFPSHFGTGAEGYFGFGPGDLRPFQHPLHLQTRCDGPQSFGYTSLARFRALDAIPFERSLRFDLEIWHWREQVEVDYAVTSYFYGDLAPSAASAPIEAAMQRGVPKLVYEPFRVPGALEGEKLEVLANSEGLVFGPQALPDTDEGKWSAGEHLFVRATTVGQFIELALPVEQAARYELVVYPTRSWDYGTLQFALDGRPAGEALVTFNAEAETKIGAPRATSLGAFELAPPRAVLRIEVVGTDPRSRPPHHYFGLDCVVLKEQKP